MYNSEGNKAWRGQTEKDIHVYKAEKVCPSDVQVGKVS